MNSGALIPRTGSSSSIACLNGHSSSQQQQWQQVSSALSAGATNGRKHGKGLGMPLSESRERCCFRLQRMVIGRRVGMSVAVLISLVSLLMLINVASHASLHFRFLKDKEADLGLISEGRMHSANMEAKNAIGSNFSIRVLSESSDSRDNLNFQPQSIESQSRLRWPLVSSDDPLPGDHPCQGFTLPPPPADKKRTGPRPCPVCYLPVKKAIELMPTVNASVSPIVKTLSYVVDSFNAQSTHELTGSEFGGYPTLEERSRSFLVQEHMKIHCGFVKSAVPGAGTIFSISEVDRFDMNKCAGVVVASAIFGNYDVLQQPRNVSSESRRSVCFFMFVDEETKKFLIKMNNDKDSNKIGLWRVVVVHNLPYSDARRNGKIPKLLLHRLFPNARFSLWIDGKLQLIVDPYQILERFLWRKNETLAISQHYKRLDVFEEAEANKAAGKYNNASIDAQIEFYQKEGIQHYDALKSPFRSDVPEGCVIIREHTPITNLFTCLWFNEVDRFTSRDQLSFAIVRDKLLKVIPLTLRMFLDCERRNFVVQAYHRELLEQKQSTVATTVAHANSTAGKALSVGAAPITPPKQLVMTLQHARHRHMPKKGTGKRKRGSSA